PVAGSEFKLTLSSKPISSPYGLGAAALLIDGGSVILLAQIAPVDNLPNPTAASGKAISDLTAAFKEHMSDGFDLQAPPVGAWVAITKELLANTFNSAFAQAQACLSGSGSIPQQGFGKKIPTPDPASIDCTPKMDCTPTMKCDLQQDTRDCRRPPNC